MKLDVEMFVSGSAPFTVDLSPSRKGSKKAAILHQSGSAEPVKRAKRVKKEGTKLYFNEGTQAAIISFQKSSDKKERSDLYVKEIFPAFEKLVENLINIHKFSGLYDSYDDLKNDCVNFLFETIPKWDSTRGTIAFSYFNVVAKNWLIIRAKQKTTKLKRNVSLDDPDSLTAYESKLVEDHSLLPSQDTILENKSAVSNMEKVLYDIRSKVKTENELACINSIITIFKNVDDIDFLNKSAVLLYMRELSGLSPKQLTATMQTVKKAYRKITKK